MKKLIIVSLAFVVAFSIGMGSAFAANSLQQGKVGVSVGMGDSLFGHKAMPLMNAPINDVVDINARYFIAKNLALLGGFGLQMDGGDYDGTYLSLSGGVRKYLSTDDFAPFIGGQLTIVSLSAATDTEMTLFDLAGMFGAEYFMSKQFSLEGAVGVGFGQASMDNPGGTGSVSTTDTYFGTRTVGIRANLYF